MNEAVLAISATFTAEPIRLPLSVWLRDLNQPFTVKFAAYNQVIQSLIDPRSLLVKDAGGFNVLLIRLQDWTQSSIEGLVERGNEFSQKVREFATQSSSPTLICFCPDSPDAPEQVSQITRQVELQITAELADVVGLYLTSTRELMDTYPVNDYFDKVADRTGHVPYTRPFYASLGTMITRRIHAILRPPTKVVVLDCDNTLWSGACGELGSRGVEVGEPFRNLQRQMLDLRANGMLLALCSKNHEQDVWDVFEQNPSMLLRREHIAASEINWKPKSENLRQLASKLGLGLDSFLLLDDNHIEIAEVRSRCPSVLAIQVPSPNRIPSFLRHVWALDRPKITTDDRGRADGYLAELQRRDVRQSSVSLRQFLMDLELVVRFEQVNETNLERMSQLTQRTNQFNSSLLRRTGPELRALVSSSEYFAFAVDVSDKFGDYGFVGLMLCRQQERSLLVDSFLLSCRALGRGVEHHMMRRLGELALELNLSEVTFPFVSGERNTPAAIFLESLGEGFGSQSLQGIEYCFPSALLRQLDPLSAAESGQSEGQHTAVSVATVDSTPSSGDSEVLSRIATDFQSVEQIQNYLATFAEPRPDLSVSYVTPANEIETKLSRICSEVLNICQVGTDDSLHDLGGTSLHVVQIHSQIVQQLGTEIPITELYTLSTIREIANRLQGTDKTRMTSPAPALSMPQNDSQHRNSSDGIAVIGMAGRFPGADNVAQFWENLINGVNSITEISDEELNLPPDSPLRKHPGLVRKAATVNDADKFDARFFGIFPKEAQVMDPQHRLMLETCWHALEDAGYCPDAVDASVGVFAGCYMNTYTLASLASNPKLLESLANSFHGGDLLTELGNDKDYLATRVSFLLNLRGPSMTVQTACSTSLVAVVQACQALQLYQCEMALAGGSTLKLPQKRGYLYSDGGMVSPDGVCRTFDADARGTVFGEGVGAVLLKRVEDAVADGDPIYGVIRGWGINNDGHSKMGYTAPSVEGQSEAIRMAHRKAGISADSISYVEAHGTGTALGDPIEVASLTKAFRETTDRNQYCAIGSLKTNIGHLDVAAGVTGIIKICQSMHHGKIPASLNFNRPNPNIDFESTPFYVATKQQEWKSNGTPRRAGLSSFGVGGTNAHVVLEEAPVEQPSAPARGPQLLMLSARSQETLDAITADLAGALKQQPELNLADVAYTLAVGRKAQNYSRIFVADTLAEAQELLCELKSGSVFTRHQVRRGVPVSFMFPGQGAQHVNMARGLYESDSVFRAHFDECCELLEPHIGFDLKSKLFVTESAAASSEVNQTTIAQPAIFTVSYSLAKRFENLGIVPEKMIGHSVGEFVAACLAGVFSLPDALRLIAFRAKSMQALPAGSMLAVRLTEPEITERLVGTNVELAAINGPSLCVVAGPSEAVEQLREKLESDEVVCRPLHTSHAFHSEMMQPAVEPMAELLRALELSPPKTPIVSSVTGEMLTSAQAIDPLYWSMHLRKTVRFTDAVERLLTESESSLLEVGAGQTLSTLARQHPAFPAKRTVLSSLPHAKLSASAATHFMSTLGRLWQSGTNIDWESLFGEVPRKRVHLPTYRFERKRFWFDENTQGDNTNVEISPPETPQAAKMVNDQADRDTDNRVTDGEQDEIIEQVIKQQLHLMKQQLAVWNS
ncbi:HAD-IIIC family phosphatase [Novipirellula herctigrandis]|uniref:HAD-IIIC family phosphatase n=1 Tax=Novipirellula herctigrandis TaxID=2527986 RepID=UPI003AF3835D